jgi:acetoacetate decarboxylase
MPPVSPSYPRGPYRFTDREYIIISYRTDPQAIRELVPEPLEPAGSTAKFEVIRMPHSTGFGDYTECGVTIPVTFEGQAGSYNAYLFLDDHPPIAGGREIWGFPKKLGHPELKVNHDQVVGTLEYSGVRVATATMGYKHEAVDAVKMRELMLGDNYNLKVIPSASGGVEVLQLVRYRMEDATVKWAYRGPAALDLRPCALAPLYRLPVLEIIDGIHLQVDITLPYGSVAYDYRLHSQECRARGLTGQ